MQALIFYTVKLLSKGPMHLYNCSGPQMVFPQIAGMKKWVTEIICLLYVLLFCYAAVSKLLDYQQFVQQLQDSPLKQVAGITAWLTPATELLLALLLIIPKTRKAGLYGSFLLMMVFTCYIIYILKYSPDIPCSCGGILENMNWTQHLAFNILFTSLALIALILMSKKTTAGRTQLRTRVAYGTMSLVVVILTIGAISVSATGINHINPPMAGDPIPEFPLQMMDSVSYFNTQKITEGKPIVLAWFHPECSHCQAELIDLIKDPDAVKPVQFYYLTAAPLSKARELYRAMHLERFNYITVGVDTGRVFYKYFAPKSTPFHAVYNTNKKLIRLLRGQVTPQEVKEAIQPISIK